MKKWKSIQFLIRMLLAEPEKYRDAINAINKDIADMSIELKKNLRNKILSYEWNVKQYS